MDFLGVSTVGNPARNPIPLDGVGGVRSPITVDTSGAVWTPVGGRRLIMPHNSANVAIDPPIQRVTGDMVLRRQALTLSGAKRCPLLPGFQ